MNKIVIIAGPTGIGKTELSLKLAEMLNGEIVSADSMQIYKGMDIGTAKVSEDINKRIKHHMISFVDPKKEYSVKEYKDDAFIKINDIISRGKFPIVVGGTGFYIEALMYKPNFSNANKNEKIREKYYKIHEENGGDYLHNLLKEVDPKRALKLHPNEIKKIVRALEVFEITGKTMSSMEQDKELNDDYEFYLFVLDMDRQQLYQRINKRIDIMLSDGLIEENKKLYQRGLNPDYQSIKGIGYREVFQYLNGEINYDEMVDLIKKNTRHYAKRQLTWFRREKNSIWINKDEHSDEEILEEIRDKID